MSSLGTQTSAITGAAVRRRVLIVDDDDGIRELLVAYLGDYGIAAEAVADGRGLRAALTRGRFDVLVLDLMLPGGEDG